MIDMRLKINSLILSHFINKSYHEEEPTDESENKESFQPGMILMKEKIDLVNSLKTAVNENFEYITDLNFLLSSLKDSSVLLCAYKNAIYAFDLDKKCLLLGSIDFSEEVMCYASGYPPPNNRSLSEVC
jgi:hypothetical protein